MKPITSYRKGQLNLKEFYNLKYEEKLNYFQLLLALPDKEKSELDNHILNTFYKGKMPTSKFLEL